MAQSDLLRAQDVCDARRRRIGSQDAARGWLCDQLREAMNRPAIAATASVTPGGAIALPAEAVHNVRVTVRRIDELVRKLSARKEVTSPDR